MAERPPTFIQAVDKDLHNQIIRLDQKLKGFLAEINAKLEALNEDDSEQQFSKEQLNLLAEEIKKGIAGIENLVKLVLDEGLTEEQFREMNQESLEEMRKEFKEKIEKLSKMREQF